MRISRLTPRLAACFLVAACASSGPGVPNTAPSLPPIQSDTQPIPATRHLTLSPGDFRYSLIQNTTIQAEGSLDTVRNAITTSALLLVEVTLQEDSGYVITVAADSVRLTAEGQASVRSPTGTFSLGRVLEVSFHPTGNSTRALLPDSLCAYGQFITAAHDLLLVELPGEIGAPLSGPRTDSVRATACRAGVRIDMAGTRQVREARESPSTFELVSRTELGGTGMLGRDSIHLSGSIAAQGTATFSGGSRLPWLVETTSSGSISVRLRDSTTVFRQLSSQRIQKQQE